MKEKALGSAAYEIGKRKAAKQRHGNALASALWDRLKKERDDARKSATIAGVGK